MYVVYLPPTLSAENIEGSTEPVKNAPNSSLF